MAEPTDAPPTQDADLTRRAMLAALAGVVSAVVHATGSAQAATKTTTRPARTTTTKKPAGRQQVTNVQVVPVPERVIDELQEYVGGTWRGSWVDRRGASGSSTMDFAVDRRTRSATITVVVNGAALGVAGVSGERVQIRLDGRATPAQVDSRTFGVATMEEAELTSWRVQVRDIPGGAIRSIDALAAPGERGALTLTYEAVLRDGTRVEYAHAWSRNGSVRAAFRSAQNAAAAAATAAGTAATSLITEAEASAIVGVPMGPPRSNGGRVGFRPGIDVSNAVFGTLGDAPKPGQICMDWSVYVADSRDRAVAFWVTIKEKWAGQRLAPWPGVGDEALASSAFPQVIVLQGRSVLEITQIFPCEPGATLDPATASTWARAMATLMVPRMT